MTTFNNHRAVTIQSGVQKGATYYISIGGQPTSTVCPTCKKSFGSEQSLRQHSQAHIVKCEGCNKPFPNKQALKQHIDSGIHHVNCKFCTKRLGSKNALAQHIADTHIQRLRTSRPSMVGPKRNTSTRRQ